MPKYERKIMCATAAFATVEPKFGIVKHMMKFRQFLLRGMDKVRHEWHLVYLAEPVAHERIDHGVTREKGSRCARLMHT